MNYNKVIKLIKATLPEHIDRTPKGRFVKRSELGEAGYIENDELTLYVTIQIRYGIIDIYYEAESGNIVYIDIDANEIYERGLINAFKEKFGKIEKYKAKSIII